MNMSTITAIGRVIKVCLQGYEETTRPTEAEMKQVNDYITDEDIVICQHCNNLVNKQLIYCEYCNEKI